MPRNPSPPDVPATDGARAALAVPSLEHSFPGVLRLATQPEADQQMAEPAETSSEYFSRILSQGDFALDIGARTGEQSLPMALATGTEGLVLALEPNPYCYEVLAEAARLNESKASLDARNIAAADSDGPLVGRYPIPTAASTESRPRSQWPLFQRRQTVPVEGRDFYYMLKTEFPHWLPKLKFVRVAAGGSTLRILESIRPILSERRPLVACEITRTMPTSVRLGLYDFLAHLGYEIQQNLPGTQQEPGITRLAMSRLKQFELVASPRPKLARRRTAA